MLRRRPAAHRRSTPARRARPGGIAPPVAPEHSHFALSSR